MADASAIEAPAANPAPSAVLSDLPAPAPMAKVATAPKKHGKGAAPVATRPEPTPQVTMVVMDEPMEAAAAHEMPATTKVDFANVQPVAAVATEGPKTADVETPAFDVKRIAIPLLGIFALAGLAIWGTKRTRVSEPSAAPTQG
jgi:hypothetical protein